MCKNPSDTEFYGESNGQIKNGGLVYRIASNKRRVKKMAYSGKHGI